MVKISFTTAASAAEFPTARALLLDLDGTVADSLGLMQEAFFRFTSSHGTELDALDFQRFNGPRMIEIVNTLKVELRLAAPAADLLAEYDHIIDEVYELVHPVDGVGEIMAAAHANRWRIGVVTSNNSTRTRRWLEHTGLIRYCTAAVCGDEVPFAKPCPDPYLEALRRLQVSAGEACAVEDTTQGALAAVAAGIKTFGYEPEGRPAQLWPPHVLPFARFAELQQILLLGI